MSQGSNIKYCNSLNSYSRLETREVVIGNVAIGGKNPIRVQSMTTTNTMDTLATVEQSIRMIEAGSELVRITAPSKNEARNLENIKNELRKRGYETPLVADIHFTPNAAEVAAQIVEKVRVNPGNYADKKKFQFTEYTDDDYANELERIREKFTPLVNVCKEHGTAVRIGTNHGSLSDRILSRFGDTPLGMVESAMEFVNICRDNDYHELILSMKASNTVVMVEAYRLLVNRMLNEGMNYPLHLGVTEAGEGEDGRIKSAVGIGTLMEDGIGDTIRVSLTEEPELEIPVAKQLVERYSERKTESVMSDFATYPINPFDYNKRKTKEILNIGNEHVPVVIADLSQVNTMTAASLFSYGYMYSVPLDKWNIQDQAADYIYTGNTKVDFDLPGTLGEICDYNCWKESKQRKNVYPLFSASEFLEDVETSNVLNFVSVDTNENLDALISKVNQVPSVLIISSTSETAMTDVRTQIFTLMQKACDTPVIIKRSFDASKDVTQLYASTDFGALLIDGLGDGIWLSNNNCSPEFINSTSFGILQASRTRISKTEYISCPSCGRTLFDLQETTAKIRKRTHHLKGVKIGIMGCIVNGPGEMADADYGYVGSGPGKITLYKGHEVVKKSIPTEQAVDALIDLIKEHGDWVEEQEIVSV
ncbi:MAG: (E)-4-hydroxy-3-methylbut-2-enyl-diphosphate synthase [Bacteroidia bacterium]|nr:(E)-4-hydroxy-3-methylbut-2-enyl-diphosphate synthase [Bacteroidia bacterium]